MTTIAADKQDNSLGIPKATFSEDVDNSLKTIKLFVLSCLKWF